jgi:hypothetical protein
LKKLAAILVLALFAFNLFGYRIFISLLEQQANFSLQRQLDQDKYDDNSLIEVKVPVSLPYLSNWSSFEKYQGETEFNGVHYKFVKRKLVNDTLILLCIPNQAKNELRTAQSDYFKQVSDIQSSNKKSNPAKDHGAKNPISDYMLKEYPVFLLSQDSPNQNHSNYLEHLSNSFSLVAEQPPEC